MLARVPTPKQSSPSKMPEATNIPRPYKLRNYYTPKEVACHNTADDCWVTLFNHVYDLTLLLNENSEKTECDPIVLASGTDITHWFDKETKAVSTFLKSLICFLVQPKTFIDPTTGTK